MPEMKPPLKPVLLIEDNEDLRVALQIRIEMEGFSVYMAKEGQKALDLLGSIDPAPGLIFTDLKMPGMDGAEFCQKLRSHPSLSKIPVVVMSGSYEVPEWILSSNNISYCRKPVSLDQILDLVQRYCS